MVKIPSSALSMFLIVFWDVLDIILKFVVHGPTENAYSYCGTLWCLMEVIWMKYTLSPNFCCVGID
jgi:hypothetical protein